MAGQLALTVGSAAAAAALSSREDWEPITLFLLLLGLSVVSELFRLETANLHISATFLSVVLAMTLLGPTPAAVLGVTTYLVNALKVRASWRATLANVSTFAFFPLVGGLLFEALGGRALEDDLAAFILAVLVVFLSMNVLNFLLIAIDIAVVDGQAVRRSFQEIYFPLAPGRGGGRPAHRRRRRRVPGRGPRRGRPAGGRRADLPVPAPHLAQLPGPQGEARAPHARARLAPGRAAQHGPADALAARQDDRAPLGGGRALLARDRPLDGPRRPRPGHRPHGRAAARHRQVHLPRLDPARRLEADRGGVRARQAPPRAGRPPRRADRGLRARSPRSSSPTTSGSTARATRTGSSARRSRSPRRSSRSPTPTT